MKSMTGFSHIEFSDEKFSICIEIKTYNSRFLELNINLPPFLSAFEVYVRDLLSKNLLRGKADFFIRVKELSSPVNVNCNKEALAEYSKAIKEAASLSGFNAEDIPLSLLLSQEGVLSYEHNVDVDSLIEKIKPLLDKAIFELNEARKNEGQALKKDILLMIEKLENASNKIKTYIPQMENIFKENLRTRFQEVLGNQIDEQRILQETAALLVKYTINEEIVRFESHLVTLKKEIEENPAPGRKIDFICQEINREVNTIGSKNQNLEVAQIVIDVKDALENIREQSRNIE